MGKALFQFSFIDVAANKNKAALAAVIGGPRAGGPPFHDHVNALHHKLLVYALQVEDSLVAQQILPFRGNQGLHPVFKAERIKRLVGCQRDRMDGRVMAFCLVRVGMMFMGAVFIMAMVVMRVIVVVFIFGDEEIGVVAQNAVKVEAAFVQHIGKGNLAALGLDDAGMGIGDADAGFNQGQFGFGHKVGLVEQDDIGKGNLLFGFLCVGKALHQVAGIHHGYDTVEPCAFLQVIIHEKGLRHRAGIGQTGGFNDDGVKLALALQQVAQYPDEVAPYPAAQAAIVHLEHFLVRADDKVIVNPDLAELIDDDGVFAAMRLAEDAVEEGGLSGSEIAGQHGNGDFRVHAAVLARNLPGCKAGQKMLICMTDTKEFPMFSTALVTLREGIEAFLIVGIATSYLARTGRTGLLSAVYAGLGVAVALSAGLGVWLVQLGGMTPFYEGLLALAAAVLVISCTVHMLRMGKQMGAHIRSGMDKAAGKAGTGMCLAVFAFVLLMVGREGVETATMLASLATQADTGTLIAGGAAGLALAGFVALAWSRYGQKVNLTLFFRVTSVFMVLFSVQLVMYAIHEFTEIGLVPLVNNDELYEATEILGPEGMLGIWLSYGLVLFPLALILWSQLTARRTVSQI